MRKERGLGWLPDEAFRVGSIGGTEPLLSGVTQRGGPSVVHGGWRHQPETRVVMLAVVPGEEPLAEDTGVLDRTEPLRELRAVLQGLELGLGERIVVGDLGARVAPRHAELRQQQRHGLAGHRRATIGVEKPLAWSDALLRASLGDQPLCERGGLPWREHPAGHVSAEDVEYHVEVEVGPLHRTQECGDVPRPHLVGGGRQEFRFLIDRVTELVPALRDLRLFVEDAVEGSDGTMVSAFIKQGGVHCGRGVVNEPVAMQGGEDRLPLVGRQGPRGTWPLGGRRRRLLSTIEPGSGEAEGGTGRFDADGRREGPCGGHQLCPPSAGVWSGMPRRIETFF